MPLPPVSSRREEMVYRALVDPETRWRAIAFLWGAVLAACGPSLERLTLPEHDRIAREFISALRAGDTAHATSYVAPENQPPGIGDTLHAIAAILPAGPVDTLRVVGVHRFEGSRVRRSLLVYELHTPAGWGLAEVGVVEQGGTRHVERFRTERIAASLATTNAFRLGGKSAGHYLILLLSIACAALSVFAAVRAARTPMRRRWLWAIFALIGTSPLSLNWTTGGFGVQLVGVQLLSAGLLRTAPSGPWMIIAAFPIGALVTLAHVRRVKRRHFALDRDTPATTSAPSVTA
jgi:hypothetical protein